MQGNVKQKIGTKRLRKVAAILDKPVKVGFVNGGLPHNVVLVWASDGNAYFVNTKHKTFRQYTQGNKLLMHKLIDWKGVTVVPKPVNRDALDLPTREWLLNRYGIDEIQMKQLSDDDIAELLKEWDEDRKLSEKLGGDVDKLYSVNQILRTMKSGENFVHNANWANDLNDWIT